MDMLNLFNAKFTIEMTQYPLTSKQEQMRRNRSRFRINSASQETARHCSLSCAR